MEAKTLYLVHNITASSGGRVLGIFSTYPKAKDHLKEMCRFGENTTDWGHFIRILEVDKPFVGPLSLPKTDKEGKPVPVKVDYICGVQMVDNQVIATGG